MDRRDLLAWQRFRDEGVGGLVAPGRVQICQQDPQRVYLSIALTGYGIGAGIYYLTTNPAESIQAGLPLGIERGGLVGSLEAVSLSCSWSGIRGQFESDTTFDAGGNTAVTVNGQADLTLSGEIDSAGARQEIELGQSAVLGQTCRYEFFLDRHQALTQAAWYVYDYTGGATFHVLEVIQDTDPCERLKSNVGELSSRMRLQSRPQLLCRGRNLFNSPFGSKPAPPRADFLPDES